MAEPPQMKFSVAGTTVVVGRDQWLLWHLPPDLDVRVHVRVEGHRAHPDAVHVQYLGLEQRPWAVTGSTLRDIQMGRLDRALQAPGLRSALTSGHASLPEVRPERCTPVEAMRLLTTIGGVTEWLTRPNLILEIPARGEPKLDFLAQVVALYDEVGRHSPRPAVEIAKVNEVAISTVHGWLKEAKALGIGGPQPN